MVAHQAGDPPYRVVLPGAVLDNGDIYAAVIVRSSTGAGPPPRMFVSDGKRLAPAHAPAGVAFAPDTTSNGFKVDGPCMPLCCMVSGGCMQCLLPHIGICNVHK